MKLRIVLIIISIFLFENSFAQSSTYETITAYANEQELQALLKAGYTPIFQNKKKTTEVGQMAASLEELTTWNFYPTYEHYVALMQQFAANYPAICQLDTIGYSNQNRLILALKISDNIAWKEPEPKVLYSSTMHGDEVVGYVLMLRFADYLLSNYQSLPEITELVNNLQIYIVPLINPDGTYYGGNDNVYASRRNNNPGGNDQYGYDINRNYPDYIKGTNPNGPTQKETKLMMDFFAKHRFRRHPEDAWQQKVARMYADTTQKYSYKGYFTDLNNGITNGWDWYPVYGGQQDYQNQLRGGREVTIEISTSKTPLAVTLPDFWEYNYRSFINYLQHALYGIRGIITDSETGKPLEAKVFIPTLDADNSHVYSDPETIENVEIKDRSTNKLNIQLKPDKTAIRTEISQNSRFKLTQPDAYSYLIENTEINASGFILLQTNQFVPGIYLLKLTSEKTHCFYKIKL